MKIECGNGSWIVTLIDHEGLQKFVCQAETWQDIPEVLERILASGVPPWTEYRSYREKKKPPEDKKR